MLLARANAPVAAESLVEALWPGHDEDDGARRLHTNVHKLRRALGEPDRLSFGPGGYRVRVERGELDAERFERLLGHAADTDDPRSRTGLLREALGLWRGDPFQGIDLPALAGEAQRLAELRLIATEDLYAAELQGGRTGTAVAELSELVGRYPLRERLQALLMTALHRSGRQADALAVFHRARQVLVEELGVEPGAELRRAQRAVLDGDETATAASPPPHAPRPAQLPSPPADFIGRRFELAALDRISASGAESPRVAAVVGTAGVGKTALVTRWAQGARERFPDGQLHIDLHGFSPNDPVRTADALGSFLRGLGVPGEAIPPDLDGRVTRFRTLTDGRRLLVVLDNASTVEQIRPLLPGTSSCFTLITSRSPLDGLVAGEGAHRIDLDPMPRYDARALLSTRTGRPDEPDHEQADQLIAHCAGLPLALRVAAERIRSRRSRDIASLVAELDVEHDRLDLLDTGDERTSIRAVLSWSYRQLSPEAARLFRFCGFHCMHPRHHVDAHAAAALLGDTDARQARRLLDELVRYRLLDEVHSGRYRMHDLLRTYATDLADRHEHRAAGQGRLLDHYLGGATHAAAFLDPREAVLRTRDTAGTPPAEVDGREPALHWLDAELPNLVCAAERALELGRPTCTVDFSTTLWSYLDRYGYFDESRRLHTLACTAARQLDDRTAEGIAVRALGVLEYRLERHVESEALLQHSLALHDSEADAALRATTRSCLAAVHAAIGRTDTPAQTS
nr:AfsR/SARP family transcriptional regulator [Saccharopolyspora sp. HNM0983]